MSKPATNLEQMIFTKLDGAQLAQVCNDAPAGPEEDPDMYKKQCNACLALDSSDPEAPRKCVAGIVANFVAANEESAPAEKAPTNLQDCASMGGTDPFC